MQPPLADALQAAIDAMLAAGHIPEPRLVIRFADGRLRLCPSGAEGDLNTLRNQHGPCEAYVVSAEGVRSAGRAASLSRNAAIFAASLGMTTGAFPKVDASFSPAGVSSPPVW